jgi:hypothetical protein
MKTSLSSVLLIALLLAALSTPAQKIYRAYENYYLIGSIGVGTFYGDVSDKKNRFFSNTPFSTFFYEDRGPAFSLDLGKHISPSVSAGLSFTTSALEGHSDILGMYMQSSIYSYGIYGRFHPLNAFLGFNGERPVDFYLQGGLSGLSFTTYKRDQITDTLIGVNNPEIPGYGSGTVLRSGSMLLNYGFGITVRVSDNFSLSLETSSNATFSDKLDAHVSDKRSFEGYGISSLGFKYHFNSSPYAFKSRYPKYTGKSKDPALRQYNKKKAVVMNTKPHRKAMSKRYDQTRGKNPFSFRTMFRRTKLNFVK